MSEATMNYPMWPDDEAQPPIPMRTPFTGLAPIGIGTSQVESVEHYCRRLANAHAVVHFRIVNFVVARSTSESDVAGNREAYRDFISERPRYEGLSPKASNFVNTLSELVGRDDVKWTGIWPLAGKISTHSFLRDDYAWCTSCYRDDMDKPHGPYRRLAWAVNGYEICTEHHCMLVHACSNCKRGYKAKRSWVGKAHICPACDAELIGDPQVDALLSIYLLGGSFMTLLCWSRLIGDLIANLDKVQSLGRDVDFERLMQSVMDRNLASSNADLARRANISKGTLSGLMSKNSLPGLQSLLRITLVADVSLAGLIVPGLWRTGVHTGDTHYLSTSILYPRRHRRRHTDSDLSALKAELESTNLTSIGALCNRLRLDRRILAERYPAESKALGIKYQQGVAQRRANREANLSKAIQTQMEALIADRKRVTKRAVARRLRADHTKPQFGAAWIKAAENLQLAVS